MTFSFSATGFYHYAWLYEPQPSMKEVRRAWWKALALLRGWQSPKAKFYHPLGQRETTPRPMPAARPLRILSVATVRRERFQWKRKMTRHLIKLLTAL